MKHNIYVTQSYALSVELLCNLLRAEASWPWFPGHNRRTDPLLSFAGPGTRLQRRCWARASTGVRRLRQCFFNRRDQSQCRSERYWSLRQKEKSIILIPSLLQFLVFCSLQTFCIPFHFLTYCIKYLFIVVPEFLVPLNYAPIASVSLLTSS